VRKGGHSSARKVIFFGPYGSGKTEVSINYALAWRSWSQRQVWLVDLDLVTPFFRIRELRRRLEALGLSVVVPELDAASELPVIPPRVTTLLLDPASAVVVDLGGDPTGARVLGSLAARMRGDTYQAYFVVNNYRPFTATVEGIADCLRRLEQVTRLAATGLVANPHLGPDTTLGDVLRGQELIQRAAAQLRLPLVFTCARKGLADQVKAYRPELEVFPLDLYIGMPWRR